MCFSGGFINVQVPRGMNPSGPVGRNPSKAQSSISLSSFSLFPSAAAKDFTQRSPASCKLQVGVGEIFPATEFNTFFKRL